MPDARAHAPATSCLPARRWRHPRAPRTPLDPSASSPLSRVSPSHALSPEHHRAEPVAADRRTYSQSHPPPLRCIPELFDVVLDPFTEPRTRGTPEMMPPSSFPSPATGEPPRCSARSGASPSSPRPPLHPL